MIKKTAATVFAGLALFFSCSDNSFMNIDKGASHGSDNKISSQGDLNLSIDIQKSGVLQKAKTTQQTDLSKLIIKLKEDNTVAINDTVQISGSNEITVVKNYEHLETSSQWSLEAFAIDKKGVVTHSGSKTFSINAGTATNLGLQLKSQYSMIRARISNPPEDVNTAMLKIDSTVTDSVTLSKGTDTTELLYDYVTTSTTHKIVIQLKQGAIVTYSGDTTLPVISGADEHITIILHRTNGNGQVTATVERTGTIYINTKIEDSSSPQGLDSHTLALYHFESMTNDTIPEETGRWPAINHNCSLVDGISGKAIAVEKGEFVSMGTIIPNFAKAGTVEFYFKFDTAFKKDSTYFLFGNRGSRAAILYKDHSLFFLKNHSDLFIYVNSNVTLEPNKWYHVVALWGSKGMRLILDNELIASSQDTSDYEIYLSDFYTQDYYTFNIGYKKWCCLEGIGINSRSENDILSFSGAIDELRISDIERY